MNDYPCVVEELTVWFKQRLASSDVQFGDEPMSYEANTRYDVQFYRLQKEAAEHWQNRHGFVATPEGARSALSACLTGFGRPPAGLAQ